MSLRSALSDISASFRQIRLRPDYDALFATEFRGASFGLDCDIILGHFVLSFGWAGAPRIFASVSEIITRYRNLPPPSNVFWADGRPFRCHLLVDDGVMIAPELANRLRQGASTWGGGGVVVTGDGAANEGKLKVGGLWGPAYIFLGYEVDLNEFTISLANGEIIGAQVLIHPPMFSIREIWRYSLGIYKNFVGTRLAGMGGAAFGDSLLNLLIGCFLLLIYPKRGFDVISGGGLALFLVCYPFRP